MRRKASEKMEQLTQMVQSRRPPVMPEAVVSAEDLAIEATVCDGYMKMAPDAVQPMVDIGLERSRMTLKEPEDSDAAHAAVQIKHASEAMVSAAMQEAARRAEARAPTVLDAEYDLRRHLRRSLSEVPVSEPVATLEQHERAKDGRSPRPPSLQPSRLLQWQTESLLQRDSCMILDLGPVPCVTRRRRTRSRCCPTSWVCTTPIAALLCAAFTYLLAPKAVASYRACNDGGGFAMPFSGQQRTPWPLPTAVANTLRYSAGTVTECVAVSLFEWTTSTSTSTSAGLLTHLRTLQPAWARHSHWLWHRPGSHLAALTPTVPRLHPRIQFLVHPCDLYPHAAHDGHSDTRPCT